MTDSVCPACSSTDASHSIISIFGDGVTTTSGGALTFDPRSGRVINTLYSSQTVSQLVQRLTPRRPRPGAFTSLSFVRFFLLWLLPSMLFFTIWIFGDAGLPNLFVWTFAFISMLVFGGPASVFLALFSMVLSFVTNRRARAQWDQIEYAYSTMLYCRRDDIVYSDTNWGRPEDFAHFMFGS